MNLLRTSLIALFLLCCGKQAEPSTATPKAPADRMVQLPLEPIDHKTIRTAILDVETLNGLESTHGLASMLGLTPPTATPPSNAWLTEHSPRWAALSAHLGQRIVSIATEIQRDLVVNHKDAVRWPAGNVGRRLDPNWLQSDIALFKLSGIVNRMDRRDFLTGEPCGELRLLYRLAYRAQRTEREVSSPLPFTLNVVASTSCLEGPEAEAKGWVVPESDSLEDRLNALKSGPLAYDKLKLKQVEVNAQVVRFPSGVETDFAGQALYLLRAYTFDEQHNAIERTLENTPDVIGILNNEAMHKDLLNWVTTHVNDIDLGVYQIPKRFLATEALSWSTLGINRWANKPFDALFANHLDSIPQPGAKSLWVSTPKAVVDRLNNGSCIGCHQSSTTAGFHLLGNDDPTLSGVTNRLQLPFSAHFHAEQSRRQLAVAALANGEEPSRYRPHSLTTGQPSAATNGNCIPSEHTGDFKNLNGLTCAADQTCEVVVRDERVGIQFGQCMPKESDLKAGNTCRSGTIIASTISTKGAFNLRAYAETFQQQQRYELPEDKSFDYEAFNCRPTVIGVPLGRAFRRCTNSERDFEAILANPEVEEICAVVGGSRFDACVEKDFHSCLDQVIGRGMVSSCNQDHFCREDYICQQLPYQLSGVPTEQGQALVERGTGFCTPTYFVFQLRLDGHPTP